MVEIIFWIISVYVCYQLNKELHRDIFNGQFGSVVCREYMLYLGNIGILWSWKVKETPLEKIIYRIKLWWSWVFDKPKFYQLKYGRKVMVWNHFDD